MEYKMPKEMPVPQDSKYYIANTESKEAQFTNTLLIGEDLEGQVIQAIEDEMNSILKTIGAIRK